MKKYITITSLLLGIAAAPCTAQAQSYTVSLGNMTVWDGVSRGLFAKDSDYATVVAEGPDGTPHATTKGSVEVGKNDKYNWHLETDPVTVPANPASKLRIKFMITNAGHTNSDEDKVKRGLNNALMSAPPGSVSGPVARIMTPIAIISALIGAGIKLADSNCDAVLFADVIEIDGASLANGAGWQTEPNDPSSRFKVVDYGGVDANQGRGGLNGFLNVPPGCDSGAHYSLVVRFTKH